MFSNNVSCERFWYFVGIAPLFEQRQLSMFSGMGMAAFWLLLPI